MVIQEFLPNPVGKDTEGEWLKLFNDGNEESNLQNWKLKDDSGKVFIFGQIKIKPGESLVLDYRTTKIQLNNNGENLFLFDQNNNLIDKLGFSGAIQEGEIVSRGNINNKFSEVALAQEQNNISQGPLPSYKSEFNLNFLLLGLALSLILSFFAVFIIKKLQIIEKDDGHQ